MSKLSILLGILCLAFSSISKASIIYSLNGVQYEWLELTATQGMSRNQVESLLVDPNSDLYGYQYASRRQIESLFTSYVSSWDGQYGVHDSNTANEVMSILQDFGITSSQVFDQPSQVTFHEEQITGYYDRILETRGLYGTRYECNYAYGITCRASMTLYALGDSAFATSIYEIDGWDDRAGFRYLTLDYESSTTGSYLLRASEVPIPSAIWLFASGLTGLIGLARRTKPGSDTSFL